MPGTTHRIWSNRSFCWPYSRIVLNTSNPCDVYQRHHMLCMLLATWVGWNLMVLLVGNFIPFKLLMLLAARRTSCLPLGLPLDGDPAVSSGHKSEAETPLKRVAPAGIRTCELQTTSPTLFEVKILWLPPHIFSPPPVTTIQWNLLSPPFEYTSVCVMF